MKNSSIGVIIILAIILIVVAWYLVSPLFIDKVVNEDFPVNEKDSEDNSKEEINSDEEPDSKVMVEFTGEFIDADSFHKTSGSANIFSESGKRYLRFENFATTNGPDLKVYLSSDTSATEYYSLGDLKGNIGNQNYEIPMSIDVEDYDYVLIWCEDFSVLFGSAEVKMVL